jgi:hypothetical protein
MYNDIRIDTWHLFVTPGKNVREFLEKGFIFVDLVSRTRGSNMNILHNSGFDRYVERDGT